MPTVQAANFAPEILEGLMPIIDALWPPSTSLPPSQVFPALRQLIQQYMSQPDPNVRRGALLALGVAVEGVSEFMGPHVQTEIWPIMIVDSGLADGDPSVRRAALTTVACICEWLEEAARREAQHPPAALLNAVADPTAQKQAYTALDAFFETLGDTIREYLP